MLFVGLTGAVTARGSAPSEIQVGFKPHVVLTHGDVSLGQLVRVQSDDAAAADRLRTLNVAFGALPPAAFSVSRERILSIIAAQAPDLLERIRWEGADGTGVRVATKSLDLTQLENQAGNALRRWLLTRFGDISVKALPSAVQIPAVASDASVSLRPVEGPVRSRMTVWVDITHGGLPVQSIPLWFAVSASQSVCVTRRSVPSRAEIGSQDVVVRVLDVAPYAGRQISDPREIVGHRAIAPLSPGQVITRDRIRDSYDVEAGDEVALRLQQGGLTLQTHGIALQSGQKGQDVHIRFPKSGSMTVARVIGQDRAEVFP